MIETLGLDNRERWNEVAKSFKDYDIYYSLEYLISFQMIGDGDPTLIYYEESGYRTGGCGRSTGRRFSRSAVRSQKR